MVVNQSMSMESTNRALKRKARLSKLGRILALTFVYIVLLMMYAPLIYVTVFSFTDAPITGQWGGFSTNNYATLFNSSNMNAMHIWTAMRNTMLVAVVSALISVILGTLGAIGIYYTRKKWWKNALEFVNQIPIVNAEIVTALSLLVLFVLVARMQTTFVTLVIGHIVLSLPYVVLSVLPKLEQMDPSLYEAAMDLGATQTRALFTVVVPDIFPGILSGFLLSITLSLDDYIITTFTKPAELLFPVEVEGEEIANFNTLSTYVDEAMRKGGLPIQLRSFTAVLFGIILLVMIGMYVKNALDTKRLKKKLKGVD